MASPKRDNELAARVLVWAALHGDKKASEHFNITSRTIFNYRKALGSDGELAQAFTSFLKEAQMRSWGEELDYSIKELLVSVRETMASLESSTTSHDEQLDILKLKIQLLNTLLEPGMAREVLFGENPKTIVKITAVSK